ncbi:UPF0280 family protein [Neopusillimonas maritima]|uniref:Thiamine biosynthesis protein ApbE n=1 Tax=Neopusillimonas maritima TaxID=2026239 RepID=A0ABX9MX68_9BURK|nr:UPF0280 family protein [Neopusillimonas maritima]MBF24044.1 hypothetical protein [Pusillimonas sp.]RII83484.1 hypothetical protein CJO09_07785 [Neopusillimonas maritima]|tara:strand:- start:90478 stop:91437 length:960 start_codon:yes stop_codon:yes gene_type:complete
MTQHALQERTRSAPSGALCATLPDGRTHFQHGPIDLIIGVEGDPDAVNAGLERAWERFSQILPELVIELKALRRPIPNTLEPRASFHSAVAQRMFAACWRHRAQFVTPMAAVAGSVADEVLETLLGRPGAMVSGADVRPDFPRAYVNNGGDIALHLAPGRHYTVGLLSNPEAIHVEGGGLAVDGRFTITPEMGIGGIATSGWRGRSQSLGIADSVTVFAPQAAQADVAATLIANQVNVSHDAIERAPANTLKDDADLGDLPVTVAVGPLPPVAIKQALDAGETAARVMFEQGAILGAVLVLQGQARFILPQNIIENALN